METVHIQEVTLAKLPVLGLKVLDNEGFWIIIWWIKGVLLHVHLKCWCLATQLHSALQHCISEETNLNQ